MNITRFDYQKTEEIVDLFSDVFSRAAGEREGQAVKSLVSDLISTTDSSELYGYIACESTHVLGAVCFSRFHCPGDKTAFILAPLAVRTDMQRKGVGGELVRFGINEMKVKGVHLLVTYGDPNYYRKFGFKQISEKIIAAPFKLSQPEGWLAQSIDGTEMKRMAGRTVCVGALNHEKYW